MTTFLTLRSELLTVQISPYGAALARVWHRSHPTSLVLGLASPEDYATAPHAIGVIVGPLAGRISHAHVRLNGETFEMPRNDGHHSLHSGPEGVQHRLWEVEAHTRSALTLRCTLQPGACGLPGLRVLKAHYGIEGGDLTLRIESTSDADTFLNATTHAYWTLDGTGNLASHDLQVFAQDLIETAPDLIPTGRCLPVASTAHDFTSPRSPVAGVPLDGTFCLTGVQALSLRSSTSGVRLDVETNQPGLVLYTGEGLPDLPAPVDCPPIRPFSALAIEAQGWPDAPNTSHFPSVLLAKGETLSQMTRFKLRPA